MKIVVDGFAVRVGSAGIGTYTRELVSALLRVAPGHEYYLADLGPCLTSGRVPSGLGGDAYHAWVDAQVKRVPAAWKVLPDRARHLVTARQAARLGAAVYLATNFLGVFHRSFRTALVVHDLCHLRFPEDTYPVMLRKLQRDLARHVDRADIVFTDSESTERDLVTGLAARPGQTQVAYPGVSELFHPVTNRTVREACRRRYGLPERFLLHVGTIEPRKNLPRLVEAFGRLTEDPTFDLGLVLAGGRGWRDDAIWRAIDTFPRRDRIVATGRVPRQDLPVLYSLAEVFVFPSLYEGFGLPVLEAMACGAPVVASHVSSLPEVAGDGAVFVDPESAPQIAEAIDRIVRDEELATSLRRRGAARAAAFPWDATARTVLECLQRPAGSRGRSSRQLVARGRNT